MKELFELPKLPGSRRSSFGAASYNGKVYVVGGHSTTAHYYPSYGFSREVHVFDVKEQRWDQLSPYPIAAQGLRIVPYNGYLYSFGGFRYDRSTHSDPAPRPDPQTGRGAWAARSTDEVFRYSIAHDEWVQVATMPRRRSSNVIGRIDKSVYLIGGWDGTPWKIGDTGGRLHTAIEEFNLEAEEFSAITTPIDPPRRAFTGATTKSEIIVAGGIKEWVRGQEFRLDRVEAFNPSSKQWRSLPSLDQVVFSPGAGIVNGKLIVAGGQGANHRNLDSIQAIEYENPNASWSEIAKLPIPSTFPEILELNSGMAGILGGHPDGFIDQPHNRFYSLDVS